MVKVRVIVRFWVIFGFPSPHCLQNIKTREQSRLLSACKVPVLLQTLENYYCRFRIVRASIINITVSIHYLL